MTSSNNVIFNKIWQKCQHYGLTGISSNGGTGKTTYFLFRLLRDALYKHIHFHVFVRYSNQMEKMAERILTPSPTYSNRQRKLLKKLDVKKEGDKFIYIVERETERKMAQIVNIHGQAFYKPYGNQINAKRALFDEWLAENGDYCPDEINKFNRLILTFARSNPYQVICLYNNTNPDFKYFKYYKGVNYQTHVTKVGVLFYFFTAAQFTPDGDKKNLTGSVQHVLENTDYNTVYNKNSFALYPVFYKNCDLYGADCICKIEIIDKVFKLRIKGGVLYIDDKFANKKSNKKLYSCNDPSFTNIRQLPYSIEQIIVKARDNAVLKTNKLCNTAFVKFLSEHV